MQNLEPIGQEKQNQNTILTWAEGESLQQSPIGPLAYPPPPTSRRPTSLGVRGEKILNDKDRSREEACVIPAQLDLD
jgi:hypothetical protein